MPSVAEIAKLLKADPKREAVDSIRGYDWQRWLTVELWLGLKGEDRIWIELGEDITVARTSGIETIQAKDLASKVSLGQKKIQEILDRALLRDTRVVTTIWTTAELGVERSSKFGEPGIRYWQRVVARDAAVAPLADFLIAAANISADAKTKIIDKTDEQRLSVLTKVRWMATEVDLDSLRARILPQIESRLLQLKVPSAGTLREAFADFLFALVAKVAVQKLASDRSLTRVDLDTLLVDTLARFANASLPTVLTDVTNSIDGYIAGLPTTLVDQEINSATIKLRKSRFFAGFDRTVECRKLAARIIGGDLRNGSPRAKGLALSWVARLVDSENSEERIEFNRTALSWDNSEEAQINASFIEASDGNVGSAMAKLAALASDAARTAGLMIQAKEKAPAEISQWMVDAGLFPSDLDGDGKTFLLILALQEQEWDEAAEIFSTVTQTDIQTAPTLAFLGAQLKLAQAIDPDLRASGISFLNMDLAGFPLANDTNGLLCIREARKLFEQCEQFCTDLGLEGNAAFCSDFALWLQLRDPAAKTEGLAKLRASFSDTKTGLRRVNFAISFGVRIDRNEIIAQANRELAKTGNTSSSAIYAKFLIAIDAGVNEALAQFIEEERKLLSTTIGPSALVMIEAQALANAGFLDRADAALNTLGDENPDGMDVSSVRRFIAEKAGEDPIRLRKAAYEASQSLPDLGRLVDALVEIGDHPKTVEYGKILFSRVKSIPVAVTLVRALKASKANAAAYEFLASIQDLVEQSEYLRANWCEQLFLQGSVTQAQSLVSNLRAEGDQPYFRRLAARIAITGGDWGALATIVDDIWRQRGSLSVQEIFFAAKLAGSVGSSRQMDLIVTGANNAGGADPAALITAYHVAVQSGIETSETAGWLNKAIALSGEDGPLTRVSMREIIDMAPGWREKQSWASQQLREGALPMFAVAASLNSSLGAFQLLRALSNSDETDPRERATVYAYSGQRSKVDVVGATIGLDGTALLTLELLGITDSVLSTFDSIHVPHATLGWLFQERDRIQFHQPRRMRDAEKLRNLIAEGKLHKFTPTVAPPPQLVNEVGFDLAAMLCEASAISSDESRFVVCVSPVLKVGSLLQEEADLSAHENALISCSAIVDRLQARGAITALEADQAIRYLATQGARWPNDATIVGDAVVYLDDVCVSYLMHLGLLGKLQTAGLIAYVSPHEAKEGTTMLKHQEVVVRATSVIDSLRNKLYHAIQEGSVKIGPRPDKGSGEKAPDDQDVDEDGENDTAFRVHPTVSIVDLVASVDAVVVDDRFLNMHHHMVINSKSVPLYTTFDLLRFLQAQSKISPSQMAHFTTKLRRFGYHFVPLTEFELSAAVASSTVVEGKFSPSAELMAIRDSILQARLSSALSLPEEATWLTELMGTFASVIKAQWEPGSDTDTAAVKCTWLVQFMDMRDWAMCFRGRDGAHLAGGVPLYLALLVRAEDGATETDAARYFKWLTEAVLAPIKRTNPRDYDRFLTYFDQIVRRSVEQLVEMATNGED